MKNNTTSPRGIDAIARRVFNPEDHRNFSPSLLNMLLIALIIVTLMAIPAIKKYGNSLYPSRVISVQATGKALVEPDIAYISFSVVSEGSSPNSLQEDNHEKINNVLAFVRSRGVEDADIKTTTYNLAPRYEYDEVQRRSFISGYTLTQSVTVKIRNRDEVARIVGGLAELGVNQIGNVMFGVEDPEVYLADARAEAFERAHEKARAIAKANGLRLGDVSSVYESFNPPVPYATEAYGRGGDALSSAALPDLQPGTDEVAVTVNVSFEFRD